MCAAAGTVCHQHGFEAYRSAMCGRCDTVWKNDEVELTS